MTGINNLNEYLEIIYNLEFVKTNDDLKRNYWIELYLRIPNSSIQKTKPGIALSLIHPYFPDVSLDSRSGFVRLMSEKCELSKLVIGADCKNTAKEKDHIWPHSLGGGTIDANRADLCERCNRGKGATIVGYFPWSNNTPDWVIQKINSIRNNIGV